MVKRGNQFTIKIEKDYNWLEYEDTMAACRELNGAALKLYIYFNSFSAGEEIAFSPQLFCYETNVSFSAEKVSFNELVSLGYLEKVENNYFLFHAHKK